MWINKCICTCHAWFDGYYDEGTWQHGFRDLTLIVESRIFQIDQKCPINGSDDYHICIVPINSYLLGNQQYLLYWKGDEGIKWNIATRSIIGNLNLKNQDISWRKKR